MNRDLNNVERDALEAILNVTNLNAVVQALSEICEEKADHIATNWQDAGLAKQWRTAAGKLGVTSTTREVMAVS
jgi:hypothetical protein